MVPTASAGGVTLIAQRIENAGTELAACCPDGAIAVDRWLWNARQRDVCAEPTVDTACHAENGYAVFGGRAGAGWWGELHFGVGDSVGVGWFVVLRWGGVFPHP